MVQKPQNKSECKILKLQYLKKTFWDVKLNFLIWLEVQEITKYLLAASSACA